MALARTKQRLSSIVHTLAAPIKSYYSKLKNHLPHSKKEKPPRGSSPIPLTSMPNAECEKMEPPDSPTSIPTNDNQMLPMAPQHTTSSCPMSEPVVFEMDDDLNEVHVDKPVSTKKGPRHSISNIKWGPSRVGGMV